MEESSGRNNTPCFQDFQYFMFFLDFNDFLILQIYWISLIFQVFRVSGLFGLLWISCFFPGFSRCSSFSFFVRDLGIFEVVDDFLDFQEFSEEKIKFRSSR